MYKGKYLNNAAAPKVAPIAAQEELTSEELLQQTLQEHKEIVKNEHVYQSPAVSEKPAPKKKKSRKGTIIFYSFYFAFVIAALAIMALVIQESPIIACLMKV